MDPSNPTCKRSHCERAQQIRARSVGCLGPGGFSGTPAASEVRHPAGQEVCLRWNAETRLAGRGSGRDLGPSPEAGACRLLLRCCGPVCPLLPPSTPPGTAPGSQRQLPRCGEAGIDALHSRRDQKPSGGVSHFCASPARAPWPVLSRCPAIACRWTLSVCEFVPRPQFSPQNLWLLVA